MKKILVCLSILVFIFVISCSDNKSVKESSTNSKLNNTTALITFIELGSVNCIPCKMMQPVMKNIEKRFKDQIKVVFYDVWTKEEAKYAKIYNINGIPTQVFLDKDGKEIYRHVGFFPEEDLANFLKSKGLKELSSK